MKAVTQLKITKSGNKQQYFTGNDEHSKENVTQCLKILIPFF